MDEFEIKVGDVVHLYSHDGFRRPLTVAAVNLPDIGYEDLVFLTTEGSRFCMDSKDRRHYNRNLAFWCVKVADKGRSLI